MDTILDTFSDIIRQNQASVYAVAYGVTGDRGLSEDVVQETFVVAWRDRAELRDEAKLPQWLRGIARNLAKQARDKAGPIANEGPELLGADPRVESADDEEVRMTWAALRELPETYREALVLYYWEDQSAREVAAALEISEQAVQQRLSRGRSLLREEVLRRVEGALRRGRPGAALTAAILAAVMATGAKAAAAATATPTMAKAPSPIVKAPVRIARMGLIVVAALVVALVVGVIAYTRTRAAYASHGGAGSNELAAAPLAPTSLPTPSAIPTRTQHSTAGSNARPVDDGRDEDPAGAYYTMKVDGGPWMTQELVRATEACFITPLVSAPAQLRVTVRHHAITSVTVAPVLRAWGTGMVVDDKGAVLSSADADAWVTAKKALIMTDAAGDVDIAHVLAACATAHLLGLPLNAADGDQSITMTGEKITPKTVDRAGYVDLDTAHGASRGPTDARVTIVAFVGLEDPFSQRLIGTLDEVIAKYPKDVRVVVKPVPLNPARSNLACEAVLAANAQGKLWPMLERVAGGKDLTLDALTSISTDLGLDVARVRTELTQHTYRDELELIQDQRTTMDIRALPSALVNGKRVHGAVPAEDFVVAIEEALGR